MSDQRRLLERMFADPGLLDLRQRDPTHPAVLRFDALGELRREGARVALPLQQQAILVVLRQMLDVMSWASPELSHDEFWMCLEDENVRRHTVGAIARAEHFEDTLMELFFWGWLRQAGFDADRVEADGLSDLVIAAGSGLEVRGDVKRIRRDTPPTRLAPVLRKANKQIKQSSPNGGGIAFVHLELPVEPSENDGIPEAVNEFVAAARAATRTHNSSVSQVVLTWDDYLKLGEFPAPVAYYRRRRSIAVEHAAPVVPAAIKLEALKVGQTAALTIWPNATIGKRQDRDGLVRILRRATTSDRVILAKKFELAPALTESSEGGLVVSARYVRNALEAPDSMAVHYLGDLTQCVLAKRVTTKAHDFVFLVVGHWRRNHWLIIGGYRLFGDDACLSRLGGDANMAFAVTLERYGVQFAVDGAVVRWSPEVTIKLGQNQEVTPQLAYEALLGLAEFSTAPERGFLPMAFSLSFKNELVAMGMHIVDIDKYEVALRAADRAN